MVSFITSYPIRSFTPNKLNTARLKNFAFASRNGLVLDFFVSYRMEHMDCDEPVHLRGQMAIKISETLRDVTVIFSDVISLFTFSKALADRGLSATGALMVNHVPKIIPLGPDKVFGHFLFNSEIPDTYVEEDFTPE